VGERHELLGEEKDEDVVEASRAVADADAQGAARQKSEHVGALDGGFARAVVRAVAQREIATDSNPALVLRLDVDDDPFRRFARGDEPRVRELRTSAIDVE